MKQVHEEIREILPDYIRGALPEAAMNEVKSHIEGCTVCRDESVFLSRMRAVEVNYPEHLFWELLPQRVKAGLREERKTRSPLRSLLLRPLPVAAAGMVLLAVLVMYLFHMHTRDVLHHDPFFRDPLSASLLDYSEVKEKDVPVIAEEFSEDEAYPIEESLTGYGYCRVLVFLDSEDIRNLTEALKKRHSVQGG